MTSQTIPAVELLIARLRAWGEHVNDAAAAIAIRSERRNEHEFRSIMAWRQREHPAWSQHAVSFRVSEPIRRVK